MRRRAIALAAIAVVALALLALGVRATHAGEVLPGVRVEGIDLAGASPGEVRRLLSPITDAAAEQPLTLVAEDRRVQLAPEEAGYFADLGQTVSDALDSGRGGPLGGLWTTVAGLFSDRDVALFQHVDRRQLERAVGSLTDSLGRRAVAAQLVIDPSTLAVRTTPPRSGREVDREAFADRLERVLAHRPRATVEVPLHTTHVASGKDIEAVARAARAFIAKPLTLTGAGDPLELSPAQLAGVLAIVTSDGGSAVRLGAGDARLAALVDAIAAKRDRPALDARMNAPPRAVTFDAKGDAAWRPRAADVTLVRPARAGRIVQRDKLTRAIESAVRENRHAIELPTVRVEPKLDAGAARKLRSLIATFTTYYVPGQPRVTNIKRIAADVDGTIVAPGARFSLNETAGERTKRGGYVEAPFIADGKIEPSIGGGVSQFSTTLYNAAYFAGLQIDGHTPHSFFIDRYPAGREATVNYPDIDMTWTNDTDAPVLIRTSTDNNSVAVSLYGDNGGRRVEATAADRDPLPDGDFSIVVTRTIRYPGGRVVQQPFTTRYDKPPADE
jgi:vancomycin resistance protein YoaR